MRVWRHNAAGWRCRRGLARALALAVLAMPLGAMAQPTQPDGPRFDAATIKLTPPGPLSYMGLMPQPDGIQVKSLPVAELVRIAYGAKRFSSPDQVTGAPEWAKKERYDIDAKMSADDTAAMQKLSKDEQAARRDQMLRALLVERMGLKAHIESKPGPVYELVVGKSGPKLTASKEGDEMKGPTGKTIQGSVMMFTNGKVRAQHYTMAGLATFLSQPMASVGRPVIDKTGLTGEYNFDLTLQVAAPAGMAVKMDAPGEEMPSIFTALQEELGLKLRPGTGLVEMLVIDHVERPTEN